ncbi:phosphoenolpyruvate--protein phosphotransferase [Pantoea sp. Nvir]|uniref:phosphoenolpyruvate--protein phosphotransferase n=1 Tax=Pantoea sp. Nvir TaxID=2576760 RepID=UPI00135CD390|nr:phosphoenolpyruvate--protein phosphotransferase [Pantoea sp. Nvir]MXP66410.1 phosphoenolpyruvate--protein phosphotransferase [Pantoea sp. Nvir]
MLTQLREIVEKVARARRLNEALDILVHEICLSMHTEVCSIYIADHAHHCYYLMATQGLKKPRRRVITLAFDEGIVGLVRRLAEPVNLADAQSHPSFKYIPAVKEERYRSFLGVPIINLRHLLGVLVVQQHEHCQFNKSEESFLVTLATQMATLLSQLQLGHLFGQFRQMRVRAIATSPGVAVALGWVEESKHLLDQVSAASTLDVQSERERLLIAMNEATSEFRRFSKRFVSGVQKESSAIFDLYSHLLADARLKKDLFEEIEKGSVAEWAVKKVIEKFAVQFTTLNNNYLRERADDLRVLGQRLLFHLDDSIVNMNAWPKRFILVADELNATMLAELPRERLAGIVVRNGAINSHAAILTRAMGIPTVMGADILPAQLDQSLLIVDGYHGELLINPGPMVVKEYKRLIKEGNALSKIAENTVDQLGELKSGERIQVMLIHNKPVTLRTLDIGADKQLPYMPISEENPCLGWRGIRLTLDQTEIFLVQVRAMLRANASSGNLSILLPMISHIDEIDDAMCLIRRAGREVEEMLGYVIPKPRVGIMIEVPSMLFMIQHLQPRVDFVSVGTNDLIQYLMAVDRNNTRVAKLYDPLHPAMLRALRAFAAEAHMANLEFCLCGEMAGDPMCVALLVGLGYHHLSMNGKNVPHVKYLLRHLDNEEAQKLSNQALNAYTAKEVRHKVTTFMEQRGLGGLIRGGR